MLARKATNSPSRSRTYKDCKKRVRRTTLNVSNRLSSSNRWTLFFRAMIAMVIIACFLWYYHWNHIDGIVTDESLLSLSFLDNSTSSHGIGQSSDSSLSHGSGGVLDTPYGHPSAKDMPNPCIVILTYNRPQSLLRTVESLKSVPGAWQPSSYQIYISQDGDHHATSDMIRDTINAVPYDQSDSSSNITAIKHIHHTQDRGHREATQKLAIHYKFMFNTIFNEIGHSHAIILEDDMIFSADFLEYFASTAYLLNDPSNELFCVSSWNDYGQDFLDHSPLKIRRTDYFPGLGWLLTRSLWIDEIGDIFPNDHWDHFMRTDVVTKGRDCLYPDVSRNYNIGEHGSTMDNRWYNLYLKPMQFEQTSRVRFRDLDLSYLEMEHYEEALIELFESKAKFIGIWPDDSDLISNQLRAPSEEYGDYLLIPYHGFEWNRIAQKVGLLDTQRTRHRDTIIIGKNGVHYIFANIRLSPYLQYNAQSKDLYEEQQQKKENMVIVAGDAGKSCDVTCSDRNLQCLSHDFEFVNNCNALRQQFQCEAGCLGGQLGEDVPNYVAVHKPGLYQKCLTTDFPPTCRASHPTTRRICPCG